MLLKAVLIVCVVRKERKEELLRRRARVLFSSERAEEKLAGAVRVSQSAFPHLVSSRVLTFLADLRRPAQYDASSVTVLSTIVEATCTEPLESPSVCLI